MPACTRCENYKHRFFQKKKNYKHRMERRRLLARWRQSDYLMVDAGLRITCLSQPGIVHSDFRVFFSIAYKSVSRDVRMGKTWELQIVSEDQRSTPNLWIFLMWTIKSVYIMWGCGGIFFRVIGWHHPSHTFFFEKWPQPYLEKQDQDRLSGLQHRFSV